MTQKRPLTYLEQYVLKTTAAGDPWSGSRGSGSRVISQALGRLQKFGLVTLDPEVLGSWVVTPEGKKLL